MFEEHLARLRKVNLERKIRDRESPQGPRIVIHGKEYVQFASNDYLGLAADPSLVNKAAEAMTRFGFGAGASRLLCGGSSLHGELEKKMASFKGTESALVFNSGYSANVGAIQALGTADTVLFSDELNHASIIDGCRLSRSATIVYRHKDTADLEACLKKKPSSRKIVITDAVFSMDGDIAPIPDIVRLCRAYGAYLYVDEAHATGVIGKGRGVFPHFSLGPEPWIIQMGTFSKALGSFGGFVAGTAETIEWAVNTARSLIFSTALPACVIAASLAALELVESDSQRIDRLWRNREKLARGLTAAGFDISGSETPIIPLRTGSIENTLRVAGYLREQGIFAPAIRPPAVRESRIRITVTAAHTDEDIERLLEAVKKI